MPRKTKGKDVESAEYKAFEALAKQVLSVPKAEIDRRETECLKDRQGKRKVHP